MISLPTSLAFFRGGDDAAAMAVAGLACGAIALIGLIALAITICIILFIGSCLKRVPPPYRKMEPAMVWLLIIPVFNLVWNFFVFKAVSESFQGYFESEGRTDQGDCGKNLGLAYSIVSCVCVIPWVGGLAGLAALVLLIITLVKFNGFKKLLPA
nr:hypothetical protein [uncultured Holophaga sp.]